MAGFRCLGSVSGVLVRCLLAQFSFALPSFLGSFQVELRKTVPSRPMCSHLTVRLLSRRSSNSPGQTPIDPD